MKPTTAAIERRVGTSRVTEGFLTRAPGARKHTDPIVADRCRTQRTQEMTPSPLDRLWTRATGRDLCLSSAIEVVPTHRANPRGRLTASRPANPPRARP